MGGDFRSPHSSAVATGADVNALRTHTRLAALAGAFVLGGMMPACSPQPSTPATSAAAPLATPATTAEAPLWGDMKAVVSVKELMRDMIDPVSDNIFNAVSSIATSKGITETEPKTDEDWQKVRTGAVSIAEAAYLLKVRRPFAPPGDLNNSTGPNPVELSPDQITAKVDRDPVEWNARIEALRNVGLEVMEIVKRKDAKEMWDAAENLDTACENCHRSYWYPGEDAAFYEGLRNRLRDARQSPQQPAGVTTKPK